MKNRLFITTILVILMGLAVLFAGSVIITSRNNHNIARDTAIEMTQLYARIYEETGDAAMLSRAGGETRITVVAPDGTVVADSRPLDIGSMQNHLDRPEIQAALNNAPAASVRYSETLGIDLLYYALKITNGDSYVFIRSAIPIAKIDAYLTSSLPLLVVLLVAVTLLCFVSSRSMIDRVVKPFEEVENKLQQLASGTYVSQPVTGGYEEIDAMIREIDVVADVLQQTLTALKAENSKSEYILNNIADGIFAVDESKDIVLINATALRIFDVTPSIITKNLNYLTGNTALTAAINDCVQSENSSLLEMVHPGRIYLINVKRLPGSKLTMVILSDVTENRENARHREEFFANASHELKTPLTAIRGMNELATLQNSDDNIQRYLNSMSREIDRMLMLIGDMLKLSELESIRETEPLPLSLTTVVAEVRETLDAVIAEKALTFELHGEGTVLSEAGHLYELVKNLVENAVRYNEPGGRVTVRVSSNRRQTTLVVSDNGIGISAEEQHRIFERFYRVEKSRSQKNGGTGLGLSIVKHVCNLYGWKLSLKSKLGAGTEVIVVFEDA